MKQPLILLKNRLLRSINHTFITLILEVKSVQNMKDLRPIGLCNVLYKIISKVLTLWLQLHMNSLIDMEHSAFTRGRLISDNILFCHEIMHNLKHRKKRKNYGMALKLDINKAYDSIEWGYLEQKFKCFGFCEVVTGWLMQFVISVSYSLQLNG